MNAMRDGLADGIKFGGRGALPPSLFPGAMDDLLEQRREAGALADYAIDHSRISYPTFRQQLDWALRLDDRTQHKARA